MTRLAPIEAMEGISGTGAPAGGRRGAVHLGGARAPHDNLKMASVRHIHG